MVYIVTEYSRDALGQVVRDLRERLGMPQEELGRKAGYRTGAGVSISRVESGLVRPTAERFAGIAIALGLTPEELEAQAAKQTGEDDLDTSSAGGRTAGAAGGASDGAKTPPSSKQLKARARKIQREIDERTTVITDLSEEFNKQHDRARDEFFMRFVEIAERVEGAPPPDRTQLEDDDVAAGDAVAAYRLESNAISVRHLLAGGAGGAAAGAAVGSAAAYGAFVAAASFGTASTGVAISGLSGVAATNAALALLGGGTLAAGGAGVAGGTIVLAGIVAAPALILGAGGLLWMAKRNRRQQQELAAKLDEAEAELAATKPGVVALKNILPRADEDSRLHRNACWSRVDAVGGSAGPGIEDLGFAGRSWPAALLRLHRDRGGPSHDRDDQRPRSSDHPRRRPGSTDRARRRGGDQITGSGGGPRLSSNRLEGPSMPSPPIRTGVVRVRAAI